MSITGGCYCGAIRFCAEGPPLHQANCHCANCRRTVGAQAVAWITVASSGFLWEQGTPQRYRTDTGAWRTFCGGCGTSLSYEHDSRPNEIDLTTGSLDRAEDFPPNRDVFPEEKLSWVNLVKPSDGDGRP
ncbi:MAG: GFA family protein [Verrucomicrobiota bacterium]|nr:GFA family protein [Verrucomicrobiota bacterium]